LLLLSNVLLLPFGPATAAATTAPAIRDHSASGASSTPTTPTAM